MIKKCDECKRCAINDDMTNVVMSSADWQRNEQRHLRREKRFVAIIVLLIILLVGSNVGWLIYESQFETVETNETIIEAEQDGSGTNIVGGGDIEYGAESKNNEANN
jgi:hypothetical protein